MSLRDYRQHIVAHRTARRSLLIQRLKCGYPSHPNVKQFAQELGLSYANLRKIAHSLNIKRLGYGDLAAVSDEDISLIGQLYSAGISCRVIAEKFEFSERLTRRCIVKYRTYNEAQQ